MIKGYFNGSFQNLVSFFAKENKMDIGKPPGKILHELKNEKVMNTLINYIIEANIGLIVFLLAYKIFLAKETDFKLMRSLLLANRNFYLA